MRWIIVALAVFESGWMAFDGARALIVGDYVTPASGPYVGQLGLWSELVSAAGIEPRSVLMKAIFVSYGAGWLALCALFASARLNWVRWAMLAAAIGALWYAPIGALLSAVQIALLLAFKAPGAR